MKNIFNTIENNRILKHCTYFFSLFIFLYGSDFLFRPTYRNLARTLIVCFGATLGMFLISRKDK